jgi:lambda family phage portal protein
MLHAFPVVRAGQVRGLSSFVSVLARLKELNECDDAFITKAKIQNLYATFEETPEPEGSVFDATDADPGDDTDSVAQVEIQPGSHIVLPPGHKLSMGDPPSGAMDYDAFTKTQLRAIAAGAGVTYEQITGDLSSVNFSSIRAGLIEFYRRIEQIQRRVLVYQFLRPIWREWFEVAVLSGRVSIPSGESSNIRKLLRPRWTTPGREYVDPEKEVKAAILRVRAGFSTREMEIAKFSGRNAEELEKEFKREMDRADAMDVVYDSDPRKVSRTGAAHSSDPLELGEGEAASVS